MNGLSPTLSIAGEASKKTNLKTKTAQAICLMRYIIAIQKNRQQLTS
jgi:hypothetical protein